MTEETEIDFGSSYQELCFKNTQVPEIGISTVHTEHVHRSLQYRKFCKHRRGCALVLPGCQRQLRACLQEKRVTLR